MSTTFPSSAPLSVPSSYLPSFSDVLHSPTSSSGVQRLAWEVE
jgi:hypothetical protein